MLKKESFINCLCLSGHDGLVQGYLMLDK